MFLVIVFPQQVGLAEPPPSRHDNGAMILTLTQLVMEMRWVREMLQDRGDEMKEMKEELHEVREWREGQEERQGGMEDKLGEIGNEIGRTSVKVREREGIMFFENDCCNIICSFIRFIKQLSNPLPAKCRLYLNQENGDPYFYFTTYYINDPNHQVVQVNKILDLMRSDVRLISQHKLT